MNDESEKLLVSEATWQAAVKLSDVAWLVLCEAARHGPLTPGIDYRIDFLLTARKEFLAADSPQVPVWPKPCAPATPAVPWPIWLAALEVLKAARTSGGLRWPSSIPDDLRHCLQDIDAACGNLCRLIAEHPVGLVPPEPKPPLGVMAKELHVKFVAEKRREDLRAAIARYGSAGFPVNPEWTAELEDLNRCLAGWDAKVGD